MSGATPRARSLRAQLIRWLAPPLVLVLALSTLASYVVAQRFATRAFDAALYDSVRGLGQLASLDSGSRAVRIGDPALPLLEYDAEDRVFYRLADPHRTLAGRADLPVPASLPATGPIYYDAWVAEEPVRCAALAIANQDARRIADAAYCETLIKRNRLARELLVALLLPQVTLAAFGLVLLSAGVRRGLAPLDAVTSAVGERGERDLSAVPDAAVPAEVAPLTRALNALLERLRHTRDAQQRFIADAAHQLRTPLAGLAAQTDRALHETDIDAMQPALEQLRASSRRAVRLVNQLLTLARAEPGSDPRRSFRRLDLARLAQDVCAEWVPQALRHDVDLGYSGPAGDLWIEGDEVLLGEMLGNLIDNAIRYGRRPGTVTVRLVPAPRVELAVEDDGPGIPEGERDRIFERFHRVPGSAPGGSGLGLAIVSEIAQAHGAEARFGTGDGGHGSVFRIVFREGPAPATPVLGARPG